MQRKKPKNKPLEASLEYEPTADSEERFSKVFELLLSGQNRYKGAVDGKGVEGERMNKPVIQ